MAATKTFLDLDLDFEPHPITGDILKLKDAAAIAGSLKNLLMVSHYEKPFHPEIGSGLRKLLFEPLDPFTTTEIKDSITQTIANFEPRISINDLKVQPDYDNNQYVVTLTFFVVNNPNPVTINFFLERTR